jgi:hypothetical protein
MLDGLCGGFHHMPDVVEVEQCAGSAQLMQDRLHP